MSEAEIPARRLRRAVREPSLAFTAALARLRGAWYKFWYPLRRKRFRAGRNFRVYGRLVLSGPGEVIMGDDVTLIGRITPWTYTAAAKITIGDRTMMDGVRFGCAQAISIGRDCIIADCRMADTDFHSTHVNRRIDRTAPIRVIPVVIEDNVFIGAEVGVLPGAWIGKNSVVGFGAICVRRYPPNSVLFGNPAKVVAPVPGTEPQPVPVLGAEAS